MSARSKHDYAVLFAEYDQRRASGESHQAIKAAFESRGIHWGTFQNRRTQAKQAHPGTPEHADIPPAEEDTQEHLGTLEEYQEVMEEVHHSVPDAPHLGTDEVHDGAVHEFEPLPPGYAVVIQPMREYTEAEDAALHESVRLFGFIGTIVKDQYGRIIDGNQRARVAQALGQRCPCTITHVEHDAHAIEIANQLNLARRHFTLEQRQQIAASLRDHGRSYRYIADALHVSHTQARADVMEAHAKVESDLPSEPSPPPVIPDEVESHFPPEPAITEAPAAPEPRAPAHVRRIQGKDGKFYPDTQPKRSHGTKVTTSKADRHVAKVIALLMNHAPQWDEKHWHAVLDVVQTLRSRQDAAPTSVSPS